VGKNTTGNTTYRTATFGYGPGALSYDGQKDWVRAVSNSCPEPATITKLGVYIDTGSGEARLGFYDATGSGGNPGALLAETLSFAVSPAAWTDSDVIARAFYDTGACWLAETLDNYVTKIKADYITNACRFRALAYGPLPNPYGACDLCHYRMSIRATYYRGKGYAVGTRFQAVCSGNSVTLYVYFGLGSSGNFRVALYPDFGNHPTTKIVESSSKTIIPGQWNPITVVSTAIVDGLFYWPLFQFDNAATLPHRETGVAGSKSFYYAMTYGSFPADLTGLGTVESDTNASIWSIYVSQDFNPPPPAPNTWGFAEGSNCFIVDYTEDYREIATMIVLKGGKDADGVDICVMVADEAAATQYGKRVSIFSESQWISVAMAELRGNQLLSVKKLPAIAITIQAPASAVRVGDIATLVSPTLGVNSNFIIQSVDFQEFGDTPMTLQLTSIVPTILDFLNLIQRNLEKR
jgi:hypothetical protein